MLIDAFYIGALTLGVLGYLAYLSAQRKKRGEKAIQPNRWSWLIWTGTTAVEAVTYNALTADPVNSTIFYVSAACCFVVTWRIWNHSTWQWPSFVEILCIVISAAAVWLLIQYDETRWAHYLTVAALPVAFIPTWKDAWKTPSKERTIAWFLWTAGDACALVVIWSRIDNASEDLPFILAELVCHGVMWLILLIRRERPKLAEGVST